MDLFLTKKNPEECNIKDEVFNNNNFYVKEEIFDNRIMKNAPDFMMDQDWSTNPDNFLDSIFSMNSDLLGDFDETKGFESIGDISEHIKKEAEGYEMANKLNSDFNIFTDNNIISNNQSFVSSNSSDSGLSSDNVDIELSPEYEPLSPAMSSPGPSVSERGERNSPSRYDSQKNILDIKKNPTIIETKPKVIVQKLPQILNFPQNQNNTKIVKSRTLNLSKGKEVKIVKLSPQLFTSAGNHKKLTFHLKNSQTGAKIQADPGTLFIKNANITEVKKLIRVQNASNPRSILLPVSIQDVKDLKTIKIVNTLKNKQYQQQLQNFNNNNNTKNDSMSDHTSDGDSFGFEETIIDEDDDDMVDDDDVSIAYKSDGNISRPNEDISYPKLILTGEEKRLLSKEGISLPTHYPLTKHEERELKRIRRKIRNKISAQDSRKRKKEYVDGLEERVKQCTEENQTLLKRIKLLQNQNQNLMSQMKKLQSLLSKGTNKTAQPTTCLMVLLLSLALVAAPNLKLGQNAKETELEEVVQETILQNRRNLLYDTKDQHFGDILDEEINMNDILAMNEILGECDSTQQLDGCKNNESKNGHSPCKKSKFLIDFDIDDQNWYQTSKVTDEIQTKKFNQIAEVFQKSMKSAQTSGFNIKDDQSIENFLDKDVLEMLSPKGNGLYELNLEKIDGISNSNTVLDIGTTKGIYNDDKLNKKINISELRNVKKY